ncbi:hypothetical protein FHY06_002716 [Variovorax sp. BK613]|nr:hypothetical protein [Variovorax sp. BK613]
MATRVDPTHASARHQFVAKAEWSHTPQLRRTCQWVMPRMDFRQGGRWIIEGTGLSKKGCHSVRVTRQYRGKQGKQGKQGSLPVARQLYLPEDWASEPERPANAHRQASETHIQPPHFTDGEKAAIACLIYLIYIKCLLLYSAFQNDIHLQSFPVEGRTGGYSGIRHVGSRWAFAHR